MMTKGYAVGLENRVETDITLLNKEYFFVFRIIRRDFFSSHKPYFSHERNGLSRKCENSKAVGLGNRVETNISLLYKAHFLCSKIRRDFCLIS
jgi:hypothetical protein